MAGKAGGLSGEDIEASGRKRPDVIEIRGPSGRTFRIKGPVSSKRHEEGIDETTPEAVAAIATFRTYLEESGRIQNDLGCHDEEIARSRERTKENLREIDSMLQETAVGMSLWDDVKEYGKQVFTLNQRVRKHEDEIKALRDEVEKLTDALKLFTFELQRNRDDVQRLREKEQDEREKMALRFENELLRQRLAISPPPEPDKDKQD